MTLESVPNNGKSARTVFLDRDGVINVNRVDHVKTWSEFEFIDGAAEALARLASTDFLIVVVSNQSAIGRQLVTRAGVEDIHARMLEAIARAGGRIDRVYYCPHLPVENCACRKPRVGLVLEASRELNIDLKASYFIGDTLEDVATARVVGCTPLLVRTGRGAAEADALKRSGLKKPVVVKDLAAAVNWILRCERRASPSNARARMLQNK